MNSLSRFKQTILIVGDLLLLYGSLLLTLWIRYGDLFYAEFWRTHVQPFTIVFLFWILIFYIAGLYDLSSLKNDFSFEKTFWYTVAISIGITALIFYLIPYFNIEPRRNLIIFSLIFGGGAYLWRQSYNYLLAQTGTISRLLIVGSGKTAEEIVVAISNNPQLGYRVNYWMKEGLQDKEFEHLSQIILANKINTLAIPAHLKKDSRAAKVIYHCLVLGIEVVDLITLYELLFRRVPLAELEEVWFLENLMKKHRIYEIIKRPLEFILALLLLLVLLPLNFLIAILIKISSRGSAFFSQRRVGKTGREFTIWKFRTMPADAEADGPRWANYHQDRRATWIGAILRKNHLDEIPQLWNILKGEISFVGPRPERPEFVAKLSKELPYYDLRHLVTSGVTGWAQINYRYAASIEDSYQKLQYDLYYIKHQSPLLDALIILRTIKFLITNHV